ncbi:MAG: phosphatidylserine decarboxylase [Candidatus Muproteobacteria bacterium RIFCSPHIGHO2_12_FULL_60_33]|uniref:Phosphatidylserine decarboxylase proenzyme n=1 Tax=Candidatus Muproteobacteria bacterium RIFCSPLOWO2_01_FULL_60_18 TaxID=1817768 RepID=A0A1F6TZR8_9PROT|nr:MAG: phosphatidylserine decarboxylase [Candidatus Muproteobacteria bacterium RIFCSPHIGHO2_01_60_12]OGI50572.1 MAG: phosphatidylserine decarboxylase [Candidatus Muproteobacteria bacterium RIFCSPLOWO2_01_FULL_60_18]OGI55203.1 MAG: phosphatidylserine decarboxylase [Candidatus Muproteobacteria bacterium RIFCSPHIGHO2_02_FULL_60_13]OGI56658.1 MAG: phosphatidylserine decarboxylase [Candidatus Muproteobacteria bacterium RIFCSPHIGHO2_12_FULL_60_33]
MDDGKYPILAREGRWHMLLAAGVAAAVHYLAGVAWAAPFWILLVFILQFFRDPPRSIPDTPDAVICPADGKVIALGEVEDPYLTRPARRVSIFMNVFNVHSNRSPVAGKIMERWYSAGKFVNAVLDKASLDNERNALWIRTDDGQDIVVVQVAGLLARRILCYVHPGARIARGERYGFIRFGSRVDVYLPRNAQFEVSLGDKVKGAADVIARFAPPAQEK